MLREREAERAAADEAFEGVRAARREAERAADAARREAARIGADLAGVNQFLRSQAGAPGGARALGDALRAKPGFELALAAVLGPRLRAAVADGFAAAQALVGGAGRDGGAALVPTAGIEGEGSDARRANRRQAPITRATPRAPPSSMPLFGPISRPRPSRARSCATSSWSRS